VQVLLWSVLASGLSITSVNGTSVVVVARDCSVNALSVSITRVSGALVVVIASVSDVSAFSGFRVTRIDGARVAVVTVLDCSVLSVSCVTESNFAFIFSLFNLYWSVNAFSSITRVNSASVVVVAWDCGMNTSVDCITRIDGASVVIITRLLGEDTSLLFVTRWSWASGFLSTVDWSEDALSSGLVTRIVGAWVFIRAMFFSLDNSLACITSVNSTFISWFCNQFREVNLSVFASVDCITSVNSACIVIVAFNCIMLYLTSGLVAVILGASILVVALLECMNTSLQFVARIISACITVIASFWKVETSLNCITRVNSAFVTIITVDVLVCTQSSVEVARISGTCIVVVAFNRSRDASSSVSVTTRSFASLCIANNRGIYTVSINTLVSGASILVITNNSGVDTSGYWVASASCALVSSIAW
jgi:hypothetical protein